MPRSSNKTSTRSFACDWPKCGKTFHRKPLLKIHYRIHTNERLYACPASGCIKTFIQYGALAVHKRSHTGEKPYQCQHIGCERRFSDSSSRNRHHGIHTGERLRCGLDGCLKSYRKKRSLKTHQQRDHPQRMALNHTDKCPPDSSDGEPPATPQHSLMTSLPHERACTDPGAQDEPLTWLPYSDDLSVQSHVDYPRVGECDDLGIPTSVLGDYYATSIHGEQTHTQLVLREKTMPQPTCDVRGTGHPDVATTINTMSPQDQLSQQAQRLSIDPQCLASGTATPVPNPWMPDSLYTHGLSFQAENTMPQSSIPVVSGPQYTPITSGQNPSLHAQQKQHQWQSYDRPNRDTTFGQLSEGYGGRGLMYEYPLPDLFSTEEASMS